MAIILYFWIKNYRVKGGFKNIWGRIMKAKKK